MAMQGPYDRDPGPTEAEMRESIANAERVANIDKDSTVDYYRYMIESAYHASTWSHCRSVLRVALEEKR